MLAVAWKKRCNNMTLVGLSTYTIANLACERIIKADCRDERANVAQRKPKGGFHCTQQQSRHRGSHQTEPLTTAHIHTNDRYRPPSPSY